MASVSAVVEVNSKFHITRYRAAVNGAESENASSGAIGPCSSICGIVKRTRFLSSHRSPSDWLIT
jgi:hypothetical protein